jgi:perosamine synthetase
VWCNLHNVYLIEDNAQAPFATEGGKYTGTIGHIGVFSLNVHKHIQCGEGGVIVTDDPQLGHRLQGCINHGELSPTWPWLGLNLRMTEPIAAIACAQLAKARPVIEGRREIGLELCDMVKDIPWLKAHMRWRCPSFTGQSGGCPVVEDCKHVYYLWTALADTEERAQKFAAGVQLFGLPMRWRYAPLLHRLFGQSGGCPVVEDIDKAYHCVRGLRIRSHPRAPDQDAGDHQAGGGGTS